MARIVFAAAVAHTALILRAKDKAPQEQMERVYKAFGEIRRRLEESGAETVILFSAEHMKSFFLDNMPSLCIGTGEKAQGWGEAGVPPYSVDLDLDLSQHVLQYGLDQEFDLAYSYEMRLDHGFMVPLHFLTPQMNIPVVPVFMNAASPPIAPLHRLYHFGKMVADAVNGWEKDRKVALVATGGISHWVAVPRMGEIAESFDRRFLELLLHHRDEEILGWSNAHIEEEAGNGALEIKSWMALAGALPQGRRELICYEPVEAWGTGIALIDFGAVIK
ncbi:hypothetical protein P9314_10710 [Paenibacillus validus]|uniref:Extradiol ring-cleavage dioxygenase class III enzyme subunit B domain-containing protein n=1 Tax=Paenibacillus validus TaxID=44253 RepID=A0A7X2ZDA9_9BACL|nr:MULTISPECIES: hypothetical protein [Paenibacillus]MED4601174.1 hypothetical protein [Paenibacillus validus]MED4606858.1 hypothetical protein [Paenibacillus validus]MUG72738.1 hypothetical protein [Paenibacillus validus]